MTSIRLSFFVLLSLLTVTALGCGDDSGTPGADSGLDGAIACTMAACDDGDSCTVDVCSGVPGTCTHSVMCSGACLTSHAAACADGGDPCPSGSCDAGPADSGTHPDSGISADGGIGDTGPAMDTGVPPDSGTMTDAGPPSCGSYGTVCTSSASCDSGLVCMEGYCMPNVDICGGTTRPMCPAGVQECFHITGTDFGGCVTPAEIACVCASGAASRFVCPG